MPGGGGEFKSPLRHDVSPGHRPGIRAFCVACHHFVIRILDVASFRPLDSELTAFGVRCLCDPSHYPPTEEPNTLWSNWPDGGTL